MIWDHDRYVKASPGSTLQSSNNGLTIFDDMGRKSGIFCCSKQICCKKRISNFFQKYRNLTSRLKISSWNVSESKEHTRNIFLNYSYPSINPWAACRCPEEACHDNVWKCFTKKLKSILKYISFLPSMNLMWWKDKRIFNILRLFH